MPGHSEPEAEDRPPLFVPYAFELVYETGEDAPATYRFVTTLVAAEAEFFWSARMEVPVAEPDRARVKGSLVESGYADVQETAEGLSYAIEIITDPAGRVLSETDGATASSYEPHDCTLVIGECRFREVKRDGSVTHFIRTTSFDGGIWRDRLVVDPEHHPRGYPAPAGARRFSVDANGVPVTMEQALSGADFDGVARYTRLSPPYDAREVTGPSQPKFPAGSYFGTGVDCAGDSAALTGGGGEWELDRRGRVAVENPGGDWRMECAGGHIMSTTCSDPGYLLAIHDGAFMRFACYAGGMPEDPWTVE